LYVRFATIVIKKDNYMPLFPIFLKLTKKKCVVVGAGKIAAAKAAGLLRSDAHVVVVGPEATEWVQEQAREGKLIWQQREFAADDIAQAFLVIAATSSSATNEAVFRACAADRVLCNVVDDPERCDFFYPAVVRRGPLQIAISTGGQSPALAHRLRTELEQQFGPEYGEWVEYVGEMRKQILRQRLTGPERRRLMDQIASPESLQKFVQDRRSAKTQAGQRKRRQLPPARNDKQVG
jgi:precorrin-2 dehydrogenase / sirohydrochlorin ferrochelatase